MNMTKLNYVLLLLKKKLCPAEMPCGTGGTRE
jgi:hypothetical protein